MARTLTDGFGNALPYAATIEGRVLLALRAGAVDMDALGERFGKSSLYHVLPALVARKLVTRNAAGDKGSHLYSLTPTGREKCPCYRDINAG